MRFYGSVYRDRGERRENEDSLSLSILRTRRRRIVLLIVADGIGGLCEGSAAGGFLCDRLREQLYRRLVPMENRGMPFRKMKRSILSEIYRANETLREYGAEKGLRLGTTLSLLLIVGRRYFLVNFGDSAVFRFRGDGRLPQPLTIPDRNPDGSISKCVGSFPLQRPFLRTGWVRRGDGYLVCSDGFYQRLDLKSGLFSPREARDEDAVLRRLSEAGRQIRAHGEKDNASAAYLCVR